MAVNKDILQEFRSITGFDLQAYYSSFASFMQNDYQYLVDYFTGKIATVNARPFDNLKSLLKQKDDLFSIFTHFKDRLNNLKWYDVMLQIEDVDSSLLTIDNISKWLRSPRTNTSFNESSTVQVGLKQSQSLESLNKDVLHDTDSQNSWVNTAIKNNLREEDYDFEGGNLLTVNFSRSGQLFINSVVDNLNGENILGKDVYQKITYLDDDLKVLDFIDTFKQSVFILSGLKTGDNPFLSDAGTDRKSIAGNRNLIDLPRIFRKLSASFATDDTIETFTIEDVTRSQDAIFANFSVKSILSQTENFKLNLTT